MDPDSELVEFKNELKGFRIAKSPKKLLKYVLSQEDNGDAIQLIGVFRCLIARSHF